MPRRLTRRIGTLSAFRATKVEIQLWHKCIDKEGNTDEINTYLHDTGATGLDHTEETDEPNKSIHEPSVLSDLFCSVPIGLRET